MFTSAIGASVVEASPQIVEQRGGQRALGGFARTRRAGDGVPIGAAKQSQALIPTSGRR